MTYYLFKTAYELMKKENELLNQTVLRLQKELDDSNKLDVSYYRIKSLGENNLYLDTIIKLLNMFHFYKGLCSKIFALSLSSNAASRSSCNICRLSSSVNPASSRSQYNNASMCSIVVF